MNGLIQAFSWRLQERAAYWNNRNKEKDGRYEIEITSVFFLLILIAWLVFTHLEIVHPLRLPPPSGIKTGLENLFLGHEAAYAAEKGLNRLRMLLLHSTQLLEHLYFPAGRLATGFVSGSLLGLTIGIICGISRRTGTVFLLSVLFFNGIPRIFLVSVCALWGVLNNEAAIFFAFLPALVNSAEAAFRSLSNPSVQDMVDAALVDGASAPQVALEVVLPTEGARSILSFGLRLGFVGALVGG